MPSKPRTRLAAALTAAAAIGAMSFTATSATADPVIPKASGNVIVEWNRTLLSLVQTPGAQPATIHPTRDFAIMSAAVSDAVDRDRPGPLARSAAPQRPAPHRAAGGRGPGRARRAGRDVPRLHAHP